MQHWQKKTVNADNTEFDIETQVAAVIKYAPIMDEKMKETKQKTISDPTMQTLKITWYTLARYNKILQNLIPTYFNHGTDMTLFHNIVLKGERIVIPA